MTREEKDNLYYVLKRTRDDTNWWWTSEGARTRRLCFYMNRKDYDSLLSYMDLNVAWNNLVIYDDGTRTLFGHKIIIRDELEHIYFGVEVDEVNNETN